MELIIAWSARKKLKIHRVLVGLKFALNRVNWETSGDTWKSESLRRNALKKISLEPFNSLNFGDFQVEAFGDFQVESFWRLLD
jgi:hypothetical protein